jgi:hypothetical protein
MSHESPPTPKPPIASFNDLPQEVVLFITPHLHVDDLASLALTCHGLYKLCLPLISPIAARYIAFFERKWDDWSAPVVSIPDDFYTKGIEELEAEFNIQSKVFCCIRNHVIMRWIEMDRELPGCYGYVGRSCSPEMSSEDWEALMLSSRKGKWYR